jgi:hypothetical protein
MADKDKLMDFLMEKAFDPVMNASPEDYDSDSKKEKLKEVQEKTRREIDRFREREDAAGVIDEFKGDMNSEPAEETTRMLRSLDLPALQDLEDEFRTKVEELGIND